jgi:ATP-dependent exoDNAse (exonuclease V) alpha subunit
MLQSETFANTQLDKVFRQAEFSGIIKIATKTRNGECFVKSKLDKAIYYGSNKDTIFIPTDKENTQDYIIKVYKHLLSKDYTDEDIIVLLPTRINNSGTLEMNKMLQEINNPYTNDKNELKYGFKNEIIFRENDKVIHIKNDYKAIWYKINEEGDFVETNNTGIFNGDVGRIYKIIENAETEDMRIYVKYNNKFIKYENGDLKNLEHSWSLTVHKSQGSSYSIVILGLDSRNYFMAKRNLLYTGITRASEQLYLCCEPYIVNKAINDNEILEKRTFLKDILERVS